MAVWDPPQIEVVPDIVAVGPDRMVTVIGCDVLEQPVVEFATINVAEYVPATAAVGTVIASGLTGNATFATSANPCASAAALKSMLYRLAPPVIALYGRLAVRLPAQTEGFAPNVMVGAALMVTVSPFSFIPDTTPIKPPQVTLINL